MGYCWAAATDAAATVSAHNHRRYFANDILQSHDYTDYRDRCAGAEMTVLVVDGLLRLNARLAYHLAPLRNLGFDVRAELPCVLPTGSKPCATRLKGAKSFTGSNAICLNKRTLMALGATLPSWHRPARALGRRINIQRK